MSDVRVLKWTVPVDDQWHPVGTGPIALVDLQDGPGAVQVWTVETGPVGERLPMRAARVYGTGHLVPDDATHLGSAQHRDTGLVWHIFAGAHMVTTLPTVDHP